MNSDMFRILDDGSKKELEYDICIVGAGVRMPQHFTLESMDVLRQCKIIYALLPLEVQDWLRNYLIDPTVINLFDIYESNALRRNNYDRAVETILSAAIEQHPIAYVTPGNPVVLDSVTQGILAGAPTHDLKVILYPGISSIDTIAVDLKYEIGHGLQMYDASTFVAQGVQPQVESACLLFQIFSFGTAYWVNELGRKSDALAPLREYLLKFYPPNHAITFVASSVKKGVDPYICSIALGNICDIDISKLSGTSLFIPRLHVPISDASFLDNMYKPLM